MLQSSVEVARHAQTSTHGFSVEGLQTKSVSMALQDKMRHIIRLKDQIGLSTLQHGQDQSLH